MYPFVAADCRRYGAPCILLWRQIAAATVRHVSFCGGRLPPLRCAMHPFVAADCRRYGAPCILLWRQIAAATVRHASFCGGRLPPLQ